MSKPSSRFLCVLCKFSFKVLGFPYASLAFFPPVEDGEMGSRVVAYVNG